MNIVWRNINRISVIVKWFPWFYSRFEDHSLFCDIVSCPLVDWFCIVRLSARICQITLSKRRHSSCGIGRVSISHYSPSQFYLLSVLSYLYIPHMLHIENCYVFRKERNHFFVRVLKVVTNYAAHEMTFIFIFMNGGSILVGITHTFRCGKSFPLKVLYDRCYCGIRRCRLRILCNNVFYETAL